MTESVQNDGWMLCIASDITQLKARGRSVRQDRDAAVKASNTDDLTGVANRRFVTARMHEMLQRPMPESGVLGCVCVLDLDNFKYINDQFGHHAGDVILRDFAKRIHLQVRRSDCFGRFGGEEFVLVLPGTSQNEAELIVDRTLAAIRRSRPLKDRADFGYTFSAGVAAGQAGDTVEDLYAR
jgi:diguanylate cyclase (GGDEF)-like protein